MIELRHLKKSFDNGTPFHDINLTVREGDAISVIGASGTGKTTLLRCINMMDPPTSGQILVDGEEVTAPGYDLSALRKKVGMVFQNFNLFKHYTVVENIMEPQIKLLKRSRQESYDRAIELLNTVRLSTKALSYPDQLSGGQQQRVAIARTLAMDPEVILFDEPTSALDPTMTGEVEEVIKSLRKTGTTMLVVTHEMRFAREIANRVVFLAEGGIYEDGTPEQVFEHPQKPLTQEFFFKRRSFERSVTSAEEDLYSLASELRKFLNSYDSTTKQKRFFDVLSDELLYPAFRHADGLSVDLKLICGETSREHRMELRFSGLSDSPVEAPVLDELNRRILLSYIKDLDCRQTQSGQWELAFVPEP